MSSGGITMLIAKGAQDEVITGSPSVSYFKSQMRQHTNFAQTVDRQVIQGNVAANGQSTVRIERRGDLLSYVYLTPIDGSGAWQPKTGITDWSAYIDKVEVLIGGQVVDEQDALFTQHIAPKIMANNYSKSESSGIASANTFYPLRFWFCENFSQSLPLVGLAYSDVELRITWGASAAAANLKWECFAHFIYLDQAERAQFQKPVDYLITQTQKNLASGGKIQELSLNHPIKLLAAANASSVGLLSATNKLKLQMNGADISDFKLARPNFTLVPLFYHMPFAHTNSDEDELLLIPFCLESSKAVSTGSVNFSRLDSARIVSETALSSDDIYAINYNVLSCANGVAATKFAN